MSQHIDVDQARRLPHLRERSTLERKTTLERIQASVLMREMERAQRHNINPTRPAAPMPAGGDKRRLRGIPAIGGPIPGEGETALLMQLRPGQTMEDEAA